MSKTRDENGDGGKTENVDPNVVLAQILQQLIANQPTRVITEDSPEYRERLVAEGLFDAFPKPVYQNGRECEPRGLSDEVRTRAATLRPGTYTIKSVTVTVEQAPNGGRHLKYKSKSTDDRMKYAAAWDDFSDLITKLWALQPVTV